MKIKRFLIFIIIFIVIAGGIYVYINHFASEKTAKIEINSNITSDVFIDGENVGHSFPISKTYSPKMVVVKIQNYETNVYLQPGIKTVINRNYKDDNISYGEIISFEQTGRSTGDIAIISNPGHAKVLIDNRDYGETPISISDLSEGKHKLEVSLEGYERRELQINVYKGYKLLGNFALLAVTPQPGPMQLTTKEIKTIVKILETPNGFLRVRKEPTTQSDEVFRVKTNEKYELKSEIKKNGWYEIMIDATRSGWISDIYTATISSEVKD